MHSQDVEAEVWQESAETGSQDARTGMHQCRGVLDVRVEM